MVNTLVRRADAMKPGIERQYKIYWRDLDDYAKFEYLQTLRRYSGVLLNLGTINKGSLVEALFRARKRLELLERVLDAVWDYDSVIDRESEEGKRVLRKLWQYNLLADQISCLEESLEEINGRKVTAEIREDTEDAEHTGEELLPVPHSGPVKDHKAHPKRNTANSGRADKSEKSNKGQRKGSILVQSPLFQLDDE